MTGESMRTPRSRRPGGPTIHDVAIAAGVSKATAARALGGYGQVSDEVRARVAAAAAGLDYRPNRRAQSITSGRTRAIGVVVGDIQLPFFATAVRAIADAAQSAGWEVVLANTNEDLARERAEVRVLYEERVDGLIVAPASSEDADHLQELRDLDVPIVLLDRRSRSLEVDAVVTDNAAAVSRAVGLLARLGHERIGIVGTTGWTKLPIPVNTDRLSLPEQERVRALAELKPAVARYKGYVDGMRAANLPIDEALIRQADYTRESATMQALTLLTQSHPATAIVTTFSLVTLGVLDAIRHAGVQIPRDVSLIGFDDADWATVAVPSITVIAQPVLELGTAAAERLLARIAGDTSPFQIVTLESRLVFRESTAPPSGQVGPAARAVG